MSRATSAMTNEICIKKSLVSCENSHSLYPYSIVSCFSLLPLIAPLDENAEHITLATAKWTLRNLYLSNAKSATQSAKILVPCVAEYHSKTERSQIGRTR